MHKYSRRRNSLTKDGYIAIRDIVDCGKCEALHMMDQLPVMSAPFSPLYLTPFPFVVSLSGVSLSFSPVWDAVIFCEFPRTPYEKLGRGPLNKVVLA